MIFTLLFGLGLILTISGHSMLLQELFRENGPAFIQITKALLPNPKTSQLPAKISIFTGLFLAAAGILSTFTSNQTWHGSAKLGLALIVYPKIFYGTYLLKRIVRHREGFAFQLRPASSAELGAPIFTSAFLTAILLIWR